MSRLNRKPMDEPVDGPIEVALVGDLTDNEGELTEKLLGVPLGGHCTLYIDSPGGSPYCAMSLATLIKVRGLRATGIVTGECSSAALWPFAACERRLVTPFSVLLFHSMKWQSEEHVGLNEAAEWARHFAQLERDMDQLLIEMFGGQERESNGSRRAEADVAQWIAGGRYVSGSELAAAGLAEMIALAPLKNFESNGAPRAARTNRPKRHAAIR